MRDDVVVVTASAESFPGLAARLRELPATVRERPLMRFAPPEDWTALDAALDAALDDMPAPSDAARRSRYTTIAFTSPRAVRAVMERLAERGIAERGTQRGIAWPSVRSRRPAIWAAGPGTARALTDIVEDVNFPSDDDLRRYGAASALARALLAAHVTGPVLFPCGDHRREELPAQLRRAGIDVDEIVCYRSVLASEHEAREAIDGAALLVVASPSVASLLASACPLERRPKLLAVGPTTAAAAAMSGWPAAATAEQPTADAVYAAAQSLLA